MQDLQKFREELPISKFKSQIVKMVQEAPFSVITGDTGSGKSTQLPQYLIDSPQLTHLLLGIQDKRQRKLRVVITQPRRVAAVSMAQRLCKQRKAKLGNQIGYVIRFEDKTSKQTYLRYVTDGILLRQCVADPKLLNYDVVILDQAHQRSLNTDILFALVKRAVKLRGDSFRLVVTSATLNTKLFSSYFNDCPVLQMHGKLFPVEVKYSPTLANSRVQDAVKAAIRMHLHEGPGDILVFLTGSEECELAKTICFEKLQELQSRGKQIAGMVIYALYGALANQDQAKAFQKTPEGMRKLVFSTNIAETSLTIDNIGFVIDSGFVKQKVFNARTNMDSIVVVPISKVQAIQRKGRAGRTQEGKCFRMYSQKFYQQMSDFTVPQIRRVSLTNVILTLKSLKIEDVINFQYIESPDRQAILKALGDLFLLGAIDRQGRITHLGTQVAFFPLEPAFSRALIAGLLTGCEEDLLSLLAILSSQPMQKRVFRQSQQQEVDKLKKMKQFIDIKGDHQTLVNIYNSWQLSKSQYLFCEQHELSLRAMRQAFSIRQQLIQLANKCNLKLCRKAMSEDRLLKQFNNADERERSKMKGELLRRCLVSGFCFNSARKMHNSQDYLLLHPKGTSVSLDPESVFSVLQEYPDYVIYTQLVSSHFGASRGVMKTVSAIQPDWIKGEISKAENVDLFALAGVSFQARDLNKLNQQNQEERRMKQQDQRKRKVEQARQRALLRKRQRVE